MLTTTRSALNKKSYYSDSDSDSDTDSGSDRDEVGDSETDPGMDNIAVEGCQWEVWTGGAGLECDCFLVNVT